MNTLSNICRNCGKCCQCLVLPVAKPLNKAIMTEWLDARGCEIVGRNNDDPFYNPSSDVMYVKVDAPCPHLTKSDNTFSCSIYDRRPEGCRIFDGRNIPFLDCAWKSIPMNYIVLEKAGIGICPHDGRRGILLRRFKDGPYWVREFKCPKGHIFQEVQ